LGGQKLIEATLKKVTQARELLTLRGMQDTRIEVDGGIDSTTILEASRAGADVFVAGTSVFKHPSGPLIGSQTLVHLLEQERIKN
jgi:ribulose-phosphate 3-epimerase